jgi:hypothetical protein
VLRRGIQVHLVTRLDLGRRGPLIQQSTKTYLCRRHIVSRRPMSVMNQQRIVSRTTITRQLRMSSQVQRKRHAGRKSIASSNGDT